MHAQRTPTLLSIVSGDVRRPVRNDENETEKKSRNDKKRIRNGKVCSYGDITGRFSPNEQIIIKNNPSEIKINHTKSHNVTLKCLIKPWVEYEAPLGVSSPPQAAPTQRCIIL